MLAKIKNKRLLYSVLFHIVFGGAALASMEYVKNINPMDPGEKGITITFQKPEPVKIAEVSKKEVRKEVKKTAPSLEKPVVEKVVETPAAEVETKAPSAGVAVPSNYNSKLHSWLEQHKRYPRAAKISRIEGRAMLFFKIDQSGNVLEYHITQSAGNESLDKAVIEMIEAANPLPAPTDFAQTSSLDFNVPVSFKLN